MISVEQFRQDLSAFSVATPPVDGGPSYSNEDVQFWLNIAGIMLNQRRWGPSAKDVWPALPTDLKLTQYDYGCELFVAHNLVLEAQANAAAANGAPPGVTEGPINSKSVDKVSVGYDTQAAIERNAGNWNLTTYGLRFIKLARFLGSGPLQVNTPGLNPAGYGGQAWPGVLIG